MGDIAKTQLLPVCNRTSRVAEEFSPEIQVKNNVEKRMSN